MVRTELLQVQFPHLLHQGVVQLVQERLHVHLLEQLELGGALLEWEFLAWKFFSRVVMEVEKWRLLLRCLPLLRQLEQELSFERKFLCRWCRG